jgi:hypothetical protein
MEPVTLSPPEKEAGQKAYQRIKVFVRNRWSPVLCGFGLFFVGNMIWGEFRAHGLERAAIVAAFWFAVVTLGAWQYQRQKGQNRRDVIFLETLKARYGEGVYSEIQEEPRSLYYYLAQKRYPPDNRQVVKLP